MLMEIKATDHVRGALHAPISVIEYGDFECPSCSLAVESIKQLQTRFPQRVRVAFRHFPLEDAHPHALLAAEAAEAAAAQGRFWEMHDLLFRHQTHLALPDLMRYAVALGLDVAQFAVSVDDHIYLQRVREHVESGRKAHLRSTPAFYVNGVLQDVSHGLQALHDAVVSAGKSKKI
jgi:protein-disulfide isomerase